MEEEQKFSFEHTRLDDVSPVIELVPEGDYHMKVVRAERKTDKNGAGYLNMRFQLVEAGQWTGRFIFVLAFGREATLRGFRRISEAVEFPHTEGDLLDWAEALAAQDPSLIFRGTVRQKTEKDNRDGTERDVNYIPWMSIGPPSADLEQAA